MTFGEQLRTWRLAAAAHQDKLEEAVGKSRGFVSRLEKGLAAPPDKTTCDLLDSLLGLTSGTVWSAAAPARLQTIDPELYEWHCRQVDGEALRLAEQRADKAVAALQVAVRVIIDSHDRVASLAMCVGPRRRSA